MNRSSGKLLRPFRFLAEAWIWGAYLPTKRGILIVSAGIAVIPAADLLLKAGWLSLWVYNAAVLILSIIDLSMLPPAKSIRVSRSIPERVEQRQSFAITLEVSKSSGMPVIVEAGDDLPAEFSNPGKLTARLGTRTQIFSYETTGKVRGDFPLKYIYLRYSGKLGLWSRQLRIEEEGVIRVFPDLSGARGIMASMQQTLILDGQRIARKDRSGMEFHYIRDYSPDDDPRAINWTATARAGRTMTNIRQPERGKIVTIMVDCGRLMAVELDGRVKLDRTLEAAMSLAAVALKQGDQVSIMAFSGDVRVYVPPGRQMEHLQQLVSAVYALKCDADESNYAGALDYLLRVQRKRSMVVLFSDMDNDLFDDELAPYLVKLRRSHSIMVLSMEDPVVAGWSRTDPITLHYAFIRSAAQAARLERKRLVSRLGSRGITALDVPAQQLALAAVNEYLRLRSREWN